MSDHFPIFISPQHFLNIPSTFSSIFSSIFLTLLSHPPLFLLFLCLPISLPSSLSSARARLFICVSSPFVYFWWASFSFSPSPLSLLLRARSLVRVLAHLLYYALDLASHHSFDRAPLLEHSRFWNLALALLLSLCLPIFLSSTPQHFLDIPRAFSFFPSFFFLALLSHPLFSLSFSSSHLFTFISFQRTRTSLHCVLSLPLAWCFLVRQDVFVWKRWKQTPLVWSTDIVFIFPIDFALPRQSLAGSGDISSSVEGTNLGPASGTQFWGEEDKPGVLHGHFSALGIWGKQVEFCSGIERWV